MSALAKSSQDAWDRAKLTYDARILLGDVDHAIGKLSEADAAMARLRVGEDDGGSHQRATDAYDDHYGQPGQDAALALILTPAPDIAAVRMKLDVAIFWDIRDEELPAPLQSLIADDVERIAGFGNDAAAMIHKPPPAWDTLKAAFDDVAKALPEEAKDEHLETFWEAWSVAMLGEADTIEAAKWKLGQLLHWTEECGPFADDVGEKYADAMFADVMRFAAKGGAA